jgi:hypothetical protein
MIFNPDRKSGRYKSTPLQESRPEILGWLERRLVLVVQLNLHTALFLPDSTDWLTDQICIIEPTGMNLFVLLLQTTELTTTI